MRFPPDVLKEDEALDSASAPIVMPEAGRVLDGAEIARRQDEHTAHAAHGAPSNVRMHSRSETRSYRSSHVAPGRVAVPPGSISGEYVPIMLPRKPSLAVGGGPVANRAAFVAGQSIRGLSLAFVQARSQPACQLVVLEKCTEAPRWWDECVALCGELIVERSSGGGQVSQAAVRPLPPQWHVGARWSTSKLLDDRVCCGAVTRQP